MAAAAPQPDAGDAGARRQVAGDRLRRISRSTQAAARIASRQVVQRRPDLHRAGLRAGRRGAPRRPGAGAARRSCRRATATCRNADRLHPHHQRRPVRAAAGLRRRRARARLHGAAAGRDRSGAQRSERLFPPTLVLDPRRRRLLMRDEIFGPILPVIGYASLDEAIAYVNAQRRPAGAVSLQPRPRQRRDASWRARCCRRRHRQRHPAAFRRARPALRRHRPQRHGRLPRPRRLRHLQQAAAGVPAIAMVRHQRPPAAAVQSARWIG